MVDHVHKELIIAWACGARIQFRPTNNEGSKWLDCPHPSWLPYYDYRLKPKEPVIKHLIAKIDTAGNIRGQQVYDRDDANIELKFDVDSGRLISAEVLGN